MAEARGSRAPLLGLLARGARSTRTHGRRRGTELTQAKATSSGRDADASAASAGVAPHPNGFLHPTRARPRARVSRVAGRHRQCSPADLRASENRPPARRWGTRTGVGLGTETADGITVTGHAHRADRLLIKPASGRQADTGLSARTHHWKDTEPAGSFENRVTNKEHRHQPDKRPRRDDPHTHSSGMSPDAGTSASRVRRV